MPLGKAIKAIIEGIPNPLPPAFMSVTDQFLGDSARFVQYKATRKTARRTQYGAPAIRRELLPIEERDLKLIHSFEEKHISVLTYQRLREYENYNVQRMGQMELERQMVEFARIFANLRIAATQQVLANAAFFFDAAGNLLPTSSGAVESISYGISASHQNQLAGIIAASWATATTDIPLHLRQIKKQARRDTGYELKYAFYGENLPSYLTANNFVKDYLSRNYPFAQKEFLENAEIPQGLFGFTWVPVYQTFFEDNASVNQSIFGVDAVTFTPEPNAEWWQQAEGSYQVPTSYNPVQDLASGANSFSTVFGPFAWARPIDNPPTATMFQGDTFLPHLRVPDAIFQADVTP